jgi:peptidoglycan/xylan/chitin deacetylase (PgdA/CDA1 family)
MSSLVLAYHAVAPSLRRGLLPDMVVAASALRAAVERLQGTGLPFVTAGELCGKAPPRAAVLTFDDGWADALTVTAPLLAELGVRGTFYVSPGLFGNTDDRGMSPEGRILTRDEAGALHELGMELGAHSMHHPDLTRVDDATLRAELADSKAAVEEITGEPCRTFAYPFGLHDERVRAATRAAGFELAMQFAPGRWEPYAVPRWPMP